MNDEENVVGEEQNQNVNLEESANPADPAAVHETRKEQILKLLKMNILPIALMFSIFIGIGLGIGLRNHVKSDNQRVIIYIKFPGEILMRMLKMFVLPLIVSCIIDGLSEINSSNSKKIGVLTICYYFMTTFAAIILGITLVSIIKPGKYGERKIEEIAQNGTQIEKVADDPIDSLLDLIRNIFPENVVEAAFRTTRTTKKKDSEGKYKYVTEMKDKSNVIGVVFFTICVAVTLALNADKGKPVINFFVKLNFVVIKLIMLVIWYSPIGIIFLIAAEIIKMKDPLTALHQVGFYTLTVVVGLLIHGFLVLPLTYFGLTRKNPIPFIINSSQALITAFGTGSSSATLPVTMHCLEVNNKVDRRISRLVLPIGATINMDGTALYEAVAAIFIAQINDIPLSFPKVIIIFITSTCASMGAAGIPQAGLVTMVMVLTAAGLPIDDISKILAVDWFLDRLRTVVNIFGDSIGAGIIYHYSKNDLEEEDRKSAVAI